MVIYMYATEYKYVYISVEKKFEVYKQIQDFTLERIMRCEECVRIHLKVCGVAHLHNAIAYDNLGQSYLMTYRPSETRKAVDMHQKAERIMRCIAGMDFQLSLYDSLHRFTRVSFEHLPI